MSTVLNLTQQLQSNDKVLFFFLFSLSKLSFTIYFTFLSSSVLHTHLNKSL